jgi:WhiB family redox-sensing transcriptional regulator
MFFSDRPDQIAAAKRVRARCEVRLPCLDYALANDERFGVWGGESESGRKVRRRAS